MKLTFLGTSDAIPSAKRNHNAILLSFEGENILVDCGEGTQRQFRKARMNPCKITRILITHWHGDHVLGLPGILQTLSLSDYNKTLFIYGPSGTKKKMEKLLELFSFRLNYPLVVKEVSGKFLDEEKFSISAEKMKHGIACNAYSFLKKGLRRIDKDKLKKSGLHEGPLLKDLKDGKDVSYQGKKYKAKDLTFVEDDVKVSFVFDTGISSSIPKFVKDSNLLVSEATFLSDLEEQAKEKMHLTAKQSAEIAKKAKVKKLILTHISARYDKNTEEVLKEAKKVFKESYLVKDLDIVDVE